MPIIVYGPAQPAGPPLRPNLVLPSVGSWVKLRNVKAWVKAGQLQVTQPWHGTHFQSLYSDAQYHLHCNGVDTVSVKTTFSSS